MITATNPNTGERIMLQNGQWLPFQEEKPMTASNPDTGERLIFRNGTWEPFEEETEAPEKQGFFEGMVKPYKNVGKIAASAVNRGLASFSNNLDKLATFVSEKTGLPKGGAFEGAKEFYQQNQKYWDDKIKDQGLTEEIAGEFLGGAAPGMAEFMLNVPYSAALGYVEGGTKGAVKEGAKRAIMGQILHAANVLKVLPRTAAMGAIGAVEAAGEGAEPRDIAKSAGVMAGFGLTAGPGKIGVKEIIGGKEKPFKARTEREVEGEIPTDPVSRLKADLESGDISREDLVSQRSRANDEQKAVIDQVLEETKPKVEKEPESVKTEPAQVKAFVTQQDKSDLKDLGYPEDMIRKLKPNEAQKIIQDKISYQPAAEPLRTPQERQQFINREFSTPEERQAIIDKEWAQEEAKMEKDIEAYTEQRRKEALKRFGLDRTSGDIAKLTRSIPMSDIQSQPEVETGQREPTVAEKNQLLIDSLYQRGIEPVPKDTRPKKPAQPQQPFQMPFEGRQYRYLGESRTTGGEQVGRWQSQGKNRKWVNIKSLPRLRKLDNAKDEVENAERVRGNVKETGERVSPEGQTQAETGAVGRGSQERIRLRTPEDEGLAEETRVNVPRETSKGRVPENILDEYPELQKQGEPAKIPAMTKEGEGRIPTVSPKAEGGKLTKSQKQTFKQLAYNSARESSGNAFENNLRKNGIEINENERELIYSDSQSNIEKIPYKDKNGTKKFAYVRLQKYDVDGLVEDSIISLKPIPANAIAVFFNKAENEQSLLHQEIIKIKKSNPENVLYWIPQITDRMGKINRSIISEYKGDFDKAYEDKRFVKETQMDIAKEAVELYKSGEKDPISKLIPNQPSPPESGGQSIDQAKSRIIDSLKDERGSISFKDIQGKPVYDDLITLGKHYYNKGYTKLSDFAKQMKTALGDAWSKVSRLMKRIFDDVKVRLAEERGSIGGPIETKTPEEIDFFEKYFGTEVTKPETQVTIKPQKAIDIQRSTKDKIAFAPKSIDLSKEGIKNLTAKTYTSFFMQEYPVKRLARQFGPEVEKDIEEQIRRVRGTGGITESILTANSKTPFIELAKSGIKEYSHLGNTSLQRILKPLKTKEVYRDYERLREAERDIAFDKYRKEDIESGKLKGIDPENAKKVLSLLKQKYGPSFETLQDISRQHTRFEQDAVLKTLLKSGWMSQEQYDAIMDRPESEFYASYLREMEDVDRQTVGGGGDPVKRIYGSEKKKLPSAEGTIGNILRTVRLVERLRLNKKIVDLKELSDDLDDVIVERKPRFKSTEITFPKRDANNKFIKGADGKRVYQTRKVSVPVGPPANTVTIAEDGKKTYYELPPDILKAVNSNSYSANDMNTLFKLMSYPARLLRAGATLSAEFIARNPVRDQFSAFVYSKYGYNPFIDFAKGIFHVVNKTDLYKEFKAAGSENSYFVSLDRQAVNLRARDMTGQGNKIKYVKNPVEALRILSEFSEKGTRVGLYAKAKSKGATTQEAATEAREGTLDFGRIGQEKAINQIIAFWNASLQGTDKLFREMKNGRAVTKAVMGITLPSITLWLLNHDKERYKELPAWRKNFFWNIIIDDGPIISIPKPFELGLIFGSLPERILDWIVLKDPDSLKDIAGAAAEGALPSVLPTAMLPAIEHITNYSFFRGQNLEPKSLENLPNYMRYSPYTTNLAKKTGKLIDVSPIKIENWVRDWTGSLGYSAMAGFDKVFMGDDIPDVGKDWYEVTPGVKGFISREPIGSGSKSVDKFYENAKEALSADAGYKFLSKHQNESESKAYAKKEKRKIALARGARKYLDNMASIRKQINSIIDNKEMEPSVKRKKIDALNKKITVLARQFNKIYDNVVNK